MRTPALVLVASAAVVGLVACNDKVDPSEAAPSAKTTVALVPFDSGADEPVDGEDPSKAPDDTQEPETTKDTTKKTTTTEQVRTIDPMPGDTAVFDTRGASDPLCAATQAVVDADEKYQRVLEDAINVANTDESQLSKVLRTLPLTAIRNAYDDLASEVSSKLRRQVATVRDFTIEHGKELQDVTTLDELSQLVAAIEDDPNAPIVSQYRRNISQYTEQECGIEIPS